MVASYINQVEDNVDFYPDLFSNFWKIPFCAKQADHNERKRGMDRNNNLPYLGILS